MPACSRASCPRHSWNQSIPPAADLCTLYARRWEIELKLRDIKSTLGMEEFAVKSPAMAHKTLWMMLIAYN